MRPEILISFLLALTVFMGCKKDPQPLSELEKLPAATQEGKNTFGCLVDGKAWVTKSSIDATAFYQEGILLITAIDSKQGMSLHIYDQILSEKNYNLNDPGPFSNMANFGDYNCNGGYSTTNQYIGNVQITHLDQSFGKWIISGTFEFEAYSEECQKTVKVTDGRFDLNYAP